MLKKIVLGGIFATLLTITFTHGKASNQEYSELTKENIEALASWDIVEWWNSKDYACVPVTCYCILYEYPSEEAESTSKGQGNAAHTWVCKGCNANCGWKKA